MREKIEFPNAPASTPRPVILSGVGAGREAKDLKLRRCRQDPKPLFRILRSFAVCAAQDDGTLRGSEGVRKWSFILLSSKCRSCIASRRHRQECLCHTITTEPHAWLWPEISTRTTKFEHSPSNHEAGVAQTLLSVRSRSRTEEIDPSPSARLLRNCSRARPANWRASTRGPLIRVAWQRDALAGYAAEYEPVVAAGRRLTGSLRTMLVPTPSTDATLISPPCASITCLTM